MIEPGSTNRPLQHAPPARQQNPGWWRIALWTAAATVATIVAAAVILPYFLDIDRYRPEISAAFSQQTGRQLTLGEIRATIVPSVGFTVDAFHMSNPRGFAPGEFLSAARIRGTLAFWPLVFRREIRIKSLDFIRPKLILLQDQRGATNYTFAAAPDAGASSAPGNSPANGGERNAAGAHPGAPRLVPGATVLRIDTVTLRDAEVIFGGMDEHGRIARTVDAVDFDVTAHRLMLQPMRVRDWQVDAKLDTARFSLAGWDGPIAFRSGSVTLRNGSLQSTFAAEFGKVARVKGTFSIADVEHAVVKFDLKTDDVDLDALVAGATVNPSGATPAILPNPSAAGSNSSRSSRQSPEQQRIPAPPRATNPAVAPAAGAAKTPAGPSELLAQGHLAAERIRSGPQIAGPATADLRLFTDRMEIWPVVVHYGRGSLQFSARTDRRQTPQRFSINAEARDVNISDIVVTSRALRGKLAGTGEFDLQAFGSLDSAWQKSLVGKGQFAIRNGRIAGVSLYSAAEAIANLPGIGADTTFTAIAGDIAIANQRIASTDMHLSSPRGTADLRGSCGLDGTLSYDGQLSARLSPEAPATSGASGPGKATSSAQSAFARLQGKNGLLTVPFSLQGTLQNPKILPARATITFSSAPSKKQREQEPGSAFPNLFHK